MKTKAVLTMADVRKMIDAASQYATEHGWKVTISVVDDGGHLLGMLRLDGAAPLTATISPGKARTSAVGCRESGSFEHSINDGRYAYLSVPQPVMLEGGLPIVVDGQVIGGIGASGAKSTEDVEICQAGIAALQVSHS